MKVLLISLMIAIFGLWVFLLYQRNQSQPLGGLTVEESLFAEIDSNGVVLRVIVADQRFIDSGKVGNPQNWIKTSSEGSVRKNYAGKGYIYDKTRDAFIPPKQSSNAVFNETKAQWIEPITTCRSTNECAIQFPPNLTQ